VRAPIAGYFNPSFKFLTAPDPKKALELFRAHGITLIPVVDRNLCLTGVMTWKDILQDVRIGP
jgi:Mg/Co/Ni transporter MgtE